MGGGSVATMAGKRGGKSNVSWGRLAQLIFYEKDALFRHSAIGPVHTQGKEQAGAYQDKFLYSWVLRKSGPHMCKVEANFGTLSTSQNNACGPRRVEKRLAEEDLE